MTLPKLSLFEKTGSHKLCTLTKFILTGGDQLQFQYHAGSGPLGVNVETSYRLADNNWHSVLVERNRKEARIVVDGALKATVREPPGPVRALHLTSDLTIGSTVDYRDGYVGCIRALLLNGQLTDLRKYAEKGLYGNFICTKFTTFINDPKK